MFGNVDVKQSRGTPAANQAAPASRPPGRLARLREDVLCVFQRDPAPAGPSSPSNDTTRWASHEMDR